MRWLVFDCESIGLHGETFAVGYLALENGELVREDGFACPPVAATGLSVDHRWVEEHVPKPMFGYNCLNPAQVRNAFWDVWEWFRQKDGYLAADVAWPVEARFLAQCMEDQQELRRFRGPYPLIDIASVRLAAGFNPLGTFDRLPDERPEHDPLADARQSARLLMEALAVVDAFWTKPAEGNVR